MVSPVSLVLLPGERSFVMDDPHLGVTFPHQKILQTGMPAPGEMGMGTEANGFLRD